MSSISKKIENHLKILIEEAESNMIEIQRNSLADGFNCVPSQINYVLDTRFTKEKGYVVETRRGGGGFVRIKKIRLDLRNSIIELKNKFTNQELDLKKEKTLFNRLLEEELITKREWFFFTRIIESEAFDILTVEEQKQIRTKMIFEILEAIVEL